MPRITELLDLKVDDENEQASLLWVYIRAYAFGERMLSSAFCEVVRERLKRDCLSGRMPFKEDAYAELIKYAVENSHMERGVLPDLIEDYALSWAESAESWDAERREACFAIDVQEKLPSAFLVRAMDYRLRNAMKEAEDVSEWLGVKDTLTSL